MSSGLLHTHAPGTKHAMSLTKHACPQNHWWGLASCSFRTQVEHSNTGSHMADLWLQVHLTPWKWKCVSVSWAHAWPAIVQTHVQTHSVKARTALPCRLTWLMTSVKSCAPMVPFRDNHTVVAVFLRARWLHSYAYTAGPRPPDVHVII